MKRVVLPWLLLLSPVLAQTNLLPFVLPWDDTSPGIADLSAWIEKPAGARGVITARNGHFYAGNRRVRFFGVNCVGPGAFPRHEDAAGVAGRLAKFGINSVRFHHLDSRWSPLIDYARGTSRSLDTNTLDRLDYFISQLIQRGIYANLNLLVGRQFSAGDGLPPEIGPLDSKTQHVIGFFHAPVLELQKEYARQLLAHRNPYTGLTYAEDPAVAFVEINNENGLIHAWLGGTVDKLPAVFQRDLQGQWTDWLRARYRSTPRLRQAWNVKAEPLGDEQLAADPGRWVLERHQGAAASVADGRITVTKTGTAGWHVQYNQPGVSLAGQQAYTLRFRAKADRPSTINVNVGEAHAPWAGLGLSAPVALATEWREFRFGFRADRTDTNARVCFSGLGTEPGQYWFADASLRPGGVTGLEEGGRLEDGSVPLFLKAEVGTRTVEAQRDWLRFLWETEDRYWQAMDRFLKDDLNYRGIVIGTVVGCSTPNLMAKLDAVDTHAYWRHPQFPGRPWDPGNWTVENQPMTGAPDGGTLPGLALRRVLGKPHCVTEYNHPAPNTYSSEAFLLLAAFAGLQDWDAIYAYCYNHDQDDWDARRIPGFFDIDQHPTKMVTLPAAAALFARGDVQPAPNLVVDSIDQAREIELLPRSRAWGLVSADLPAAVALRDRVAIATRKVAATRSPSTASEFVWNPGLVTVNTPRSKAVIGLAGGKRIDLGGVLIEAGPTMQSGWCAITVTELQARRWLVTATGYAENTAMGWKNQEKSTVGRDWGRAPSLVEVIPATVTIPGLARAWALDERGQRRAEVAVQGNQLEIGPQFQTLWYEAETR